MIDPHSLLGEVIEDRYVLCEVVGDGNYGVVFAAEERSFGEAVGTVALKLIRPKGPDSRAAVIREVRAMASLSHPNLLAYRSSGEVSSGPLSGCLYLATELASYSLEKEIVQRGRLDEEEVRSLALDVARALGYLHSQQAVHRDVKPENVLRVGSSWKLADFGLVRAFSGTQLSASGTKGTPFYMSPEALDGQTGPHVDVWAFGVMLQRASTGSFPYSGGSEGEVYASILTKEASFASGLPSWLDALVRVCLEREYKRRPQASALPGLIEGSSSSATQTPKSSAPETSEPSMSEEARKTLALAQQGDATAQYNIGEMFDEGLGVSQDDVEAVKWYRKSAEQGHAYAQFLLGVMYEDGRGVSQNGVESVKWYRKSAEQGLAVAQCSLGRMYEEGSGVSQNDKEAVKWYRQSAEQGYAYAQFFLGVMYEESRGVSQSNVEAVKWFRKSAEQGNAYAQFCLGLMYEGGRGAPKSKGKAMTWYRKAAEQGSELAQEALRRLEER